MKKLFLLIMLMSSINAAAQSLIDEEVQQVASKALSEQLYQFNDSETLAGAVVMETNTGNVVANISLKYKDGVLIDVPNGSAEYIPAGLGTSVLYLAMMPTISPDTEIDTGSGIYIDREGFIFYDQNYSYREHNKISLINAYANNSDIGILKAAEAVWKYDMKTYAEAINKTGILFGGRGTGEGAMWRSPDILGYSSPMTILQQTSWCNAVAGGKFVIREDEQDPDIPYDVIENVAGLPYLQAAMRHMVTDGLGKRLNSNYIPVAAVSNITPPDVEGKKCAFVGAYFPYDKPRYTVACFILKYGYVCTYHTNNVARNIIDWLALNKIDNNLSLKKTSKDEFIHPAEK